MQKEYFEKPQDGGEVVENNSVKDNERNSDGTFANGHKKLGGIKLGGSHFKTDMDDVLEEIAKLNKISFNEARKILLRTAYSQAKGGNFNYWKEIIDRYYGKVVDNVNLTVGKQIAGCDLDKVLDYVKTNENNSILENKEPE